MLGKATGIEWGREEMKGNPSPPSWGPWEPLLCLQVPRP